jgi:uncharacterized protein (TIGR02996 family)
MAIEGDRIGPYTLLRRVQSSGLFEVFEASHHKLVFAPISGLALEDELWSLLREGAEDRRAIAHPRVPPLEEIIDSDGRSFFQVYPLIEGPSLIELRKASRSIPPMIAARIFERVARAAGTLEDRVVARLERPNIRVDPTGFVWLTFSLTITIPPDPTRAGVIKGKFAFMSPEAVRGAPLEPASSVFTLGALLHAAIEGQSPFRDDSDLQTLRRIVDGDRAPMSIAPPELERIVARCLERSPNDRYASPFELADALDAMLGGEVTDPDLARWVGDLGFGRSDDADTAPAAPVTEEETLLRAIEHEPKSTAPYLVYADWLQTRGHPRGDLIVLQHRAALAKDAAEKEALHREHMQVLSAHREALIGELEISQRLSARRSESFSMGSHFVGDPRFGPVALQWSMGFIQSARVAVDRETSTDRPFHLGRTMHLLTRLESARFLKELTIGALFLRSELSLDFIYRALPLELDLESLCVGDLGTRAPASIHTTVRVVTKYRRLERLALRGARIELPVLDLPRLSDLRIHFQSLGLQSRDALARSTLPALRRLELAQLTSSASVPLRSLFESEGIFAVEHLVLFDREGDRLARAVRDLAATPLAARLRAIELAGDGAAAGRAALRELQGRFVRLDRTRVRA